MPQPNPFSDSVFMGDPRVAPERSAPLHERERLHIASAIGRCAQRDPQQPGELLLLRSARAGSGKSHLLARVVADCAASSHALPVVFNRESEPNWVEMLRQMVEQLAVAPNEGTPSPLSETARLVFAELVGDLIHKGVVPAENPNRAIVGLQKNYRSMFDLRGDPESPIVRWFKENAGALAEPLAISLRRRTRFDMASCRFWVDLLYRFETGDDTVLDPPLFELGEGEAKARARDLGKLVSRYRPLVFVFDHLDGLFGDPDAGLGAAYLFSELARIGVAPLSIIALNDDLWASSFASSVPNAIADRLTSGEIRLGGINQASAQALLGSQLESADVSAELRARFFEVVDLDAVFDAAARAGDQLTPRDLLRLGAEVWETGHRPGADTGESLPREHVSTGQAPKTDCPSPTRETLSRIREMLYSVNRKRPGEAEEEPRETEAPAITSPWGEPDASAPAAVHEFARTRESLYLGSDLLFDPSAIRHTLELAGRRSPLIEYGEFDVTGGSAASRWRSPDREILFGFEPAERTPYWRALIEQAGESSFGLSKVVAFTPPGTPAFVNEGLNGSAKEHLDVLELDRETLASLAAAQAVLEKADSEDETFRQIAPELETLWRRITRPMGA